MPALIDGIEAVVTEASASIGNHPCQALRKDDPPCAVRALRGSEWCFAHDPTRAAQRDEARRKGGRGKAHSARIQKLVPASLKPTLVALFAALEEVHRGDLDPKQAQAMAALAGAIARLYTTAELEQRVTELEQVANGR